MRIKTIIAAAAAFAVITACGPKGEKAAADGADSLGVKQEVVKKSADLLPSKAQKDSVSYLIGVIFSDYINQYNFGEVNYNQVVKGIKDGLKARGQRGSDEYNAAFKIVPTGELINDLFGRYLSQRFEYISLKNKEDGQKAIEKYLKKGYTLADKGFAYKIDAPGQDVKIAPKDTVEVQYKGTFTDGTVFDQSKEENGPFSFVVQTGPGGVIEGWVEGIQLIGEGGSIHLVIPGDLAYGSRGNRGIEPNKTLLFDINVVSVKPYQAPESAE